MIKKSRTDAEAEADLVQVGQPAPDFTLTDQAGRQHQLSGYRGRWVVLYFYPKDNTTGCTKEACQFRDRFEEFHKRGVVVVGVSPDSQQSHEKFASQHQLPFDLLADEGAQVCQQFGVWQEKSMYGRKYFGVVRTTYLIDKKGVVAERWDKVKVARHEQQVMGKLEGLMAGP